MQERQFEKLLTTVTPEIISPAGLRRKVKSIETANNKAYAKQERPADSRNYERTPTANELIIFRQWAIDYKKQIPKASKRQVRKAVQEHFHIRIFR